MQPQVAFLHDFLLVPGGAEQFAMHVMKRFADIDGTCGFIDRDAFSGEDFSGPGFRALTSPSRIQGWQGIKTMRAFQSRCGFIRDYDAVIYSGIYSPLAVKHHLHGRNIYYCHTPPRFVYDLRDYYLSNASPVQKILLDALVHYFQPRYEKAIGRMDTVIANSSNVRARLEEYLGVPDVNVIHPPVYTDQYAWIEQGDYYLSTARLEPYKRVDLVVRAFMNMPEKMLVVASGGSQLETLQRLAKGHGNIRFTGWCKSAHLQELVGRALATIYVPIDEDFGMSPIESMAAGKPVIGVAEGGLLESVLPGETGILIDPIASEGLTAGGAHIGIAQIIDAVGSLDKARALTMRFACVERVALFSDRVFDAKFAELLNR